MNSTLQYEMDERIFRFLEMESEQVKNRTSEVDNMKELNSINKHSNSSISSEDDIIATNLERKGIYSPDFNRINIPKPVIFPPPQVSDRVVNGLEQLDEQHSNLIEKEPLNNKKQINKRKSLKRKNRKSFKCKKLRRGYQSLRDLYSIQLPSPPHRLNPCESGLSSEDIVKENGARFSLTDESNVQEVNEPELNIIEESTSEDTHSSVEENKKEIMNETEPLVKQFTEMLEESTEDTEVKDSPIENIEENDVEKESLQEEHEPYQEESCNQLDEEDSGIIVKLPVLLATIELEIDILRSVDLVCPIEKDFQLDLSIDTLNTYVLLPSNTIFVNGVFIAQVDYIDEVTKTYHTVRLPIEWEKVIQVDWLITPEQSYTNNQEYSFQFEGIDVGSHYEFTQTYHEPIEDYVKGVHFVWHHDLDSPTDSTKISIQGTTKLSIDLLQKQYVRV